MQEWQIYYSLPKWVQNVCSCSLHSLVLFAIACVADLGNSAPAIGNIVWQNYTKQILAIEISAIVLATSGYLFPCTTESVDRKKRIVKLEITVNAQFVKLLNQLKNCSTVYWIWKTLLKYIPFKFTSVFCFLYMNLKAFFSVNITDFKWATDW